MNVQSVSFCRWSSHEQARVFQDCWLVWCLARIVWRIVVTQVTSSKVTTYPLIWQGSNIDGYIPTLSTSKDETTGRIDVLVHVGSLLVTMYNDGTGFQGTKP